MPDSNPVDKVLHGKTAGLPNSIWIVILGSALALGWYIRKKKAGSTTATGVASDGSGTDLGYEVGQNPITFLNVTPPPASQPVAQTAQDNNQWFNMAVQWAANNPDKAPSNLSAIQEALNANLQGLPTTLWQRDVYDKMITAVGAPPEIPSYGGALYEKPGSYGKNSPAFGNLVPGKNWFGTLGGTTFNPSGSGVGDGSSKPAGVVPLNLNPHVYVIQPEDNMQSIADRYGMSWQTLYNANRQVVKNPAMVGSLAGTQLHIPQ